MRAKAPIPAEAHNTEILFLPPENAGGVSLPGGCARLFLLLFRTEWDTIK